MRRMACEKGREREKEISPGDIFLVISSEMHRRMQMHNVGYLRSRIGMRCFNG